MVPRYVRPGAAALATALAVTVLLALSASGASAAWMSTGGAEGSRVDVRVLDSQFDRTTIEIIVPGFEATPVAIDDRTYYRVGLPGEGNLLDAGWPELPHICRSLIIPDAAGMTVRVLEEETTEFPSMPVIPSKGNLLRTVDPETVPYAFGPFYDGAAAWPESPARLGEPYILRDYRGIVVEALPFRAGADGGLRVSRRLVLEVAAAGLDLRNAIDRSGPPAVVAQDFLQIYQHQFLNFGLRYTPVGERGTMLIICHDAFAPDMAPFVQWKLQSGIPTVLVNVSVIGNTSTAIKNYIAAQYAAGPLAYVLLVGDAAQIATPSAAGGASDPTYACIAGSDRYPELFIGRFSAENAAHVQTQVLRSVTYEKSPFAGAPWYAKGTGIASNQGTGDDGEYDDEHEDVIREKLLAYGYTHVDQIYDPSGTSAMVAAALNDGRSIVNYTGHGSTDSWSSTGFSNSNVAALQNDWMLPFIISVACVNGQFNGYTCFGEAWLRSVRNGNPIGAIGAYMSSINQSWDPPMCGQDEVVDLLVGYEMFTFGGLCFNGSCQMMDEYGSSDGGNMFLTWHIFGDPSLWVRTKVPAAVAAQHDGALILGQTEYAVSVPGAAGARCALYGNGTLYGSAYTDLAGYATIVLDPAPPEPMTLTLTVTAPNIIPVQEPVEVSPASGPFLVFHSAAVVDPAGDGDGQCDAGETIDATLSVRNVGIETATGVVGVLSEEDPYLEIVAGTQTFGDVPPEGIAPSQAPFCLRFAPDTPDNHTANLTLAVTANEGAWNRPFGLTVGAPVLACASHETDDSPPNGNGSGWIEAGETFTLALTIRNTGHANANAAVVTLTSGGPYIEILEGTATCENIPAGGEGAATPLLLRALPESPAPIAVTLEGTIQTDYGAIAPLQIQFTVGGFADDCEANRGWTLGATGDNATSGLWVLADPVGTTYGGGIPQPEDDHTPAPGSICYVTGNGGAGGAAGDADVDGGRTTLLSPVFDLSRVEAATLHYWFWYTNDLGNNPGQDTWRVEVTTDGVNWTSLETTMASTNAWAERDFELHNLITLTDRVQIRFVAEDLSPGSLVEALVDDFTLTVGGPSEGIEDHAPAVAAFALERPSPNPCGDRAELRFAVPGASPVAIDVYDVSGRLVRSLVHGLMPAGVHSVAWDRTNASGRRVGSGVYFVRMTAPGFSRVRTVTLVE